MATESEGRIDIFAKLCFKFYFVLLDLNFKT